MLIGLKRIIRGGFINFWRSGTVAWAAVLVVTITLSVLTFLILLQSVLQLSLERLPEAENVAYTSAEEALRIFKERHANDYSTLEALEEIGENPLGASLNVKAKEVSQYETIANFLKEDNLLSIGSDNIIEKVNYYQNKLAIDRLNSIITGAQRLGFLITLILAIIAAIITFNTIRLTIYISREEIGVMRLVGASKMGVRGPFLIEGAIYGVIAAVVTMLIYLPLTFWLSRNMKDFLGLDIWSYYLSNFFQIFTIILSGGIILGMISSFLAIRKYLNK